MVKTKSVLAALAGLAIIASSMAFASPVNAAPATVAKNIDSRWSEANADSTVEELNALPKLGKPIIPWPSETTDGNTPPHIHQYAQGVDYRHQGSIVGVHVTRNENIKIDYAVPCSGPIYRTSWLQLNNGDWIETGTAHWCNGTKSWFGFWGNHNTGLLQFLFNIQITGTTSHGAWIHRDQSNPALWHFLRDTWRIYTLNLGGSWVGMYTDHGLETYANWATVSGHTRLTNMWTLLWDGSTNPYWWVSNHITNEYVDSPPNGQMHSQLHSTLSGHWNEVSHCQNFSAASGCGSAFA